MTDKTDELTPAAEAIIKIGATIVAFFLEALVLMWFADFAHTHLVVFLKPIGYATALLFNLWRIALKLMFTSVKK